MLPGCVNADSPFAWAKLNWLPGPVSGGHLYFHCALEGHKMDALKECDKVCFTVIGEPVQEPNDWWYHVKSVICRGRISLIDDEEEPLPRGKGFGDGVTWADLRSVSLRVSVSSCGRRDSNPYAVRHQILSLGCLPIPTRPQKVLQIYEFRLLDCKLVHKNAKRKKNWGAIRVRHRFSKGGGSTIPQTRNSSELKAPALPPSSQWPEHRPHRIRSGGCARPGAGNACRWEGPRG